MPQNGISQNLLLFISHVQLGCPFPLILLWPFLAFKEESYHSGGFRISPHMIAKFSKVSCGFDFVVFRISWNSEQVFMMFESLLVSSSGLKKSDQFSCQETSRHLWNSPYQSFRVIA